MFMGNAYRKAKLEKRMSSTTQTSVAINMALVTQAQQAAHDAHRERCKTEIIAYAPATANVSKMQSYAACVEFVYPTHTESDVLGMKIIVGVLLAATVIGVAVGVFKESPGYRTLTGLFFGIVGFGVGCVSLAVVASVRFLFS